MYVDVAKGSSLSRRIVQLVIPKPFSYRMQCIPPYTPNELDKNSIDEDISDEGKLFASTSFYFPLASSSQWLCVTPLPSPK